jgi:YfiH family protein
MNSDLVLFEKSLPSGKYIVFSDKPKVEVLTVKQTHSSIVLNEMSCQGLEADAIVGTQLNPKAILTADCLPIIVLGKKGHAVVHAGWRGLKREILLSSEIAKLDPFYAFIGPHISVEHYEVQADFKNEFNNDLFIEARSEKLFFNLSKVAKAQLSEAYKNIKIEESEICTFSNINFHSYRRDKTTKRNWNVYFP